MESIALGLLVHYVGDAHQPLNGATRIDEKGEGDKGGNLHRLKKKLGVKNLHAAWDSVLYILTERVSLPLNTESWLSLGRLC